MSRGLNKPFRFDLSAARAGQGERVGVSGRDIRVVAASSAAALASIALEGEFNTSTYDMVEQAHIFEAQGFEAIFIKNDAQAGEWIEIIITDGPEDFIYERPLNNNIQEIIEPVVVKGGPILTHGDVTIGAAATPILAADANRVAWTFFNNGANTVYLGGAGVTTATGYPVPAGGEKSGTGGYALYGIVAAATENGRYMTEGV